MAIQAIVGGVVLAALIAGQTKRDGWYVIEGWRGDQAEVRPSRSTSITASPLPIERIEKKDAARRFGISSTSCVVAAIGYRAGRGWRRRRNRAAAKIRPDPSNARLASSGTGAVPDAMLSTPGLTITERHPGSKSKNPTYSQIAGRRELLEPRKERRQRLRQTGADPN